MLIDMKRNQNAGIALARIKLPFEEIRQKIFAMDDATFSFDQLQSLEVMWNTEDMFVFACKWD
jgi:hypothetical protein